MIKSLSILASPKHFPLKNTQANPLVKKNGGQLNWALSPRLLFPKKENIYFDLGA